MRRGRRGRLRGASTPGRVSRLPLRLRLVAGFAAAMLVVLSAAGIFVYWRVQFALDRRLDADLAAQAQALAPSVGADGALDGAATGGLAGADGYQVLDARGQVLAAGQALGAGALLAPDQVSAALRAPVHADVGRLLPISARPLRLLATPLRAATAPAAGAPAVLVVAVRRDARDEALRELVLQLLIAGAGTLVITTVVGERLAKAALAPVERYSRQARTIAAGAAGVRLDIPDRREDEVTRLGATLNEMLASLEEAAARERRFLAEASHELRTPLTLLTTRVQLTLRRTRSPAEHEAVLRELETDIAELADLAEQLLDLEAAVATAPGHAAATVGAQPAGDVARVVAALEPPEPGPGAGGGHLPATWNVHGAAAGTAPVAMPDAQVRQVLVNLLTNARVHGATPVDVDVRVEGGVVVLAVSDAGPGVPAAFLPVAIERFGRTDDARGRPGAGLGLSVVGALVTGYGGELRLCSAGVHHRYGRRHDLPCAHRPTDQGGTTASALLPVWAPPPPDQKPGAADRATRAHGGQRPAQPA